MWKLSLDVGVFHTLFSTLLLKVKHVFLRPPLLLFLIVLLIRRDVQSGKSIEQITSERKRENRKDSKLEQKRRGGSQQKKTRGARSNGPARLTSSLVHPFTYKTTSSLRHRPNTPGAHRNPGRFFIL